jgi:hypothetical protein
MGACAKYLILMVRLGGLEPPTKSLGICFDDDNRRHSATLSVNYFNRLARLATIVNCR